MNRSFGVVLCSELKHTRIPLISLVVKNVGSLQEHPQSSSILLSCVACTFDVVRVGMTGFLMLYVLTIFCKTTLFVRRVLQVFPIGPHWAIRDPSRSIKWGNCFNSVIHETRLFFCFVYYPQLATNSKWEGIFLPKLDLL